VFPVAILNTYVLTTEAELSRRVKDMEMAVSLLLMLVMLGTLIQSSQAVVCYSCVGCDQPTDTTCSSGDVCVKATAKEGGAFAIHSATVLG